MLRNLLLKKLKGLGSDGRAALADLRREAAPESLEYNAEQYLEGPGNEGETDDGFDGDDERDPDAITTAIRDILDARGQCVPYSIDVKLDDDIIVPRPRHRVYRDTRTWRQRLQNAHANWKEQMPLLVEAYLNYQDGGNAEEPAPETIELRSSIDVLDIYTLRSSADYTVIAGQRTSEALIAAGYLPNSPISPSVAISLKTLELFRSIRLFKGSFSTEAFTKLICHQYSVSLYAP